MDKEITLASRGKRLGGALIDTLVSLAVGVPILLLTGVLQDLLSGRGWTWNEEAIFLLFGLVVFTIVHGYLLHRSGQTVGKFIVKTRIVDLQGEKPHLTKLLSLRYCLPSLFVLVPIVGNFFGLIDALFIFGRDRRCLHDLLAGTQVINV